MLFAAFSHADNRTTLAGYATAQDSDFSYSLIQTNYSILYTTYIFEFTSQSWHEDDVEPEQWEHWLVVVEPRLIGKYTEYLPFFSLVQHGTALVQIVRGNAEHDDRPSGASQTAVERALEHRCIVAEIQGIPIGPVAFEDEEDDDWWEDINPFNDDEEGREEDALLAKTFDLALESGDMTWPALAPMVKGVIQGMDVIEQFFLKRSWGLKPIDSFVLTGHSKRGWTVWLTAALDSRVAAIAPLSYDSLDIRSQYAAQETYWDSLGETFEAYQEFDLFERMQSENGIRLVENVDPYYYRDQITVPTLILVGTGDGYSTVDAAGIYLEELQADTYLHYEPNKGHDIRAAAGAQKAIDAFFASILKGERLPALSWTFGEEGTFTMSPDTAPQRVVLWSAANPAARDFRQEKNIAWQYKEIAPDASGIYSGVAGPAAETGFTAFFLEARYRQAEDNETYAIATPVHVFRNN